MTQIKYLLNLPWTIAGLLNLIFCLPNKVSVKKQALVFYCRSCGLIHLYAPRAKGVALGNIVIVRYNQPESIVEHELVHVEQFMREPFIHFFLSLIETVRHGYWNNRYEIEAYDRSNTWPKEKRWY